MQYIDITEKLRVQVPLVQPLVEDTFRISLGDIAVRSIAEYERYEDRRSHDMPVARAGFSAIYGGWMVPQSAEQDAAGIAIHELNHVVLIRLSGVSSLNEHFQRNQFCIYRPGKVLNLNEGFAELMKMHISQKHGIPITEYEYLSQDIAAMQQWAKSRGLTRPATIARRLVEYAQR